MAPHSPGTDQIDTLLWIGFVAAAIVIVAINGALIYALRRYRGERGAEPRQVRGGRAHPVPGRRRAHRLRRRRSSSLSLVYTDKAREIPTTGAGRPRRRRSSEPLQIEATGQQWLWRYDYPNEAFSYYKLVVPVDTTVELDLVSTDVIHTWDVPELAGKRDAVPGKTNQVVFRADEEGVYDGQSATFSGQAYAAMRTEVDVVSPQEYEDFVKQPEEPTSRPPRTASWA